MDEYDFYVRGPDDKYFEQIPGGTHIQFMDMLGRAASDNVYKACSPGSEEPVICERGYLEC